MLTLINLEEIKVCIKFIHYVSLSNLSFSKEIISLTYKFFINKYINIKIVKSISKFKKIYFKLQNYLKYF